MAFEVMVDPETLREQVKEKYREVATNPRGSFHFHTGRPLAARERMLREAGFKDIEIGDSVDTFGGSRGEEGAREFDVYGFPFLAWKHG